MKAWRRCGRYLLSFTVCALLAACLCAAAYGAVSGGNCGMGEDENAAQWSYDSTTKTLTISGYGKMGNFSYFTSGSISSSAPWFGKDITTDRKSVV